MSRLVIGGLVGAFAIAMGLAAAVAPIVRAHLGDVASASSGAPNAELPEPERALLGARQWLNTPPLHGGDLHGKVVLVNFWTYSCINSLRALPYVRAWAAKYQDRGLVVIGVHTPEFGFEKDVDNVRQADAALGVGYPVALDSDYAIWSAFGNEAWPAFYIIDANGRVRGRVPGEGGYEQSERLIQQLLSEANGAPVADAIAPVVGVGPQAAADLADLRSEEAYVGYAKAGNFVSRERVGENAPRLYHAAPVLQLGQWSLAGLWTVGGEFATLNDAPGAIRFRFHARDLNLVLAPSTPGKLIRFRVTIDGAAPGAGHGWDVATDGRGSVQVPRMYQLVRQQGPVADRTFEIQFLDAGARAYVFTFG